MFCRIKLNVQSRLEESTSPGLTLNQTHVCSDVGLLKYEWIAKIQGKKPAVVVYVIENTPCKGGGSSIR